MPENTEAGPSGLEGLPETPTWCVDQVEVAASGRLSVSGWLVRPADAAFDVLVNGVAHQPRTTERPDLAPLVVPGAGNVAHGFVLDGAEVGRRDTNLTLRVGGMPVADTVHFPATSWREQLPDDAARARVHGSADASGFLLVGYSTYKALIEVLQSRLPQRRGIELLDWGCGCGRVSRYIAAERRFRVTGIDIDADNVAWCAAHLRGRFAAVDLQPPTSLPNASIDAVIGVSVMTHLAEPDQRAWLGELARIVRPGGIALLTTHGWHTARRSGLHVDTLRHLTNTGFVDVGVNPNIPAAVAPGGYYRNVFNTPWYVGSRWEGAFHVEALLPGLIGGHQDLVVLRRTPD